MVVEPNRLRGEVRPSAVPNRLRDEVRPLSASYVAPARWPRSQVIGIAFVAELLLIPGCIALFGTVTLAAAAMVVWLLGHLVIGAWIATAGGGGRTWIALVVGQIVAGVVIGMAVAGGYVIGVLPVPNTWGDPSLAISFVALIPLLVGLFAAPITLFGAVLATGRVQATSELRHWSVATRQRSWQQPVPSLEQRTAAWEPLDEVGLAKATADGAATRVIRAYRVASTAAAMIRADERMLATIGYRMTAVEAEIGRQGLRAELTWLVGFLLGIVGVVGFALWPLRDLGRRMRDSVDSHIVATYTLESAWHAPIELPLDEWAEEGEEGEAVPDP